MQNKISDAIVDLMESLTEREKIAIEMRSENKTYKEIAEKFAVCPARAQQIYCKGVRKIRNTLFEKGMISKNQKDAYLPY